MINLVPAERPIAAPVGILFTVEVDDFSDSPYIGREII